MMVGVNAALDVLKSHFEDCKESEFSRGQVIYFQNEVPRIARILLSGSVRATLFNVSDIARNIAIVDEGDVFPLECVFGKEKSCRYFYEASTAIKCLDVPMKQLRSEIEQNMQVKNALFERISTGYIGSLINIEALGQPRVREKIIYIFRYLLQRYGVNKGQGWWAIDTRVTQNDIASMIGVTRETVAVELSKLKKEGIIDSGSFQYSLNLKELAQSTNDEDWKQFTAKY